MKSALEQKSQRGLCSSGNYIAAGTISQRELDGNILASISDLSTVIWAPGPWRYAREHRFFRRDTVSGIMDLNFDFTVEVGLEVFAQLVAQAPQKCSFSPGQACATPSYHYLPGILKVTCSIIRMQERWFLVALYCQKWY